MRLSVETRELIPLSDPQRIYADLCKTRPLSRPARCLVISAHLQWLATAGLKAKGSAKAKLLALSVWTLGDPWNCEGLRFRRSQWRRARRPAASLISTSLAVVLRAFWDEARCRKIVLDEKTASPFLHERDPARDTIDSVSPPPGPCPD